MRRTITIFSFLLAANVTVEAQLVELPLNVRSSSVTLQLQGPLLNASGRAANYSGVMVLDENDFTRSRVTINADLSAVSLQGQDGLSGVDLQPLFKTIPNPKGVFSSSEIRRISANRYVVRGTWVRGTKRQAISFPLEVVKLGRRSAQVRIQVSAPIEPGRGTEELGGLLVGSQGSADATLVFSR